MDDDIMTVAAGIQLTIIGAWWSLFSSTAEAVFGIIPIIFGTFLVGREILRSR